jgi:hypothetical protein
MSPESRRPAPPPWLPSLLVLGAGIAGVALLNALALLVLAAADPQRAATVVAALLRALAAVLVGLWATPAAALLVAAALLAGAAALTAFAVAAKLAFGGSRNEGGLHRG